MHLYMSRVLFGEWHWGCIVCWVGVPIGAAYWGLCFGVGGYWLMCLVSVVQPHLQSPFGHCQEDS